MMKMKQMWWSGFVVLWCLIPAAKAAFVETYAPANWTLSNNNADGFIDLSGAPARARLVGGNNYSVGAGTTEWFIAIPFASTISFDWSYATMDDTAGPWDRGGWRKNSQYVELASNTSTNLKGHVSITLTNNDVLGFWVQTADNLGSPGELTISNFVFTAAQPRFLSTTMTNESITLKFATVPGRTYRIEGASSLVAPAWGPVGSNISAVSNVTTATTSSTNFIQRFFRLLMLP